jgi:putative Mg2+ transporter-C (MgtC) family protein
MALFDSIYVAILVHLLVALVAGSLIGYERSYQGRPAGFRTHALVCIASSLLMLVTVYQSQWFIASDQIIRIDPTRMAQGIMTGIGFLGAGVIVKEGASVRGLTTAASIWITAALGILAGCGFYFPLIIGTLLTLGTLSIFRWIEAQMTTMHYVHHVVRFPLNARIPEPEYRQLVRTHGFSLREFSYAMNADKQYFEYRMLLRSEDIEVPRRFADTLALRSDVREFNITPVGD